jgi:hypothetical protein
LVKGVAFYRGPVLKIDLAKGVKPVLKIELQEFTEGGGMAVWFSRNSQVYK